MIRLSFPFFISSSVFLAIANIQHVRGVGWGAKTTPVTVGFKFGDCWEIIVKQLLFNDTIKYLILLLMN